VKKILSIVVLLLALVAHAQPGIGQPVPAFDTRLLDGSTLSGQALKGRVVLVVFWATWCPACQKELPQLQSLYEKYRDRGFEILALSIDADKFVVEEFWKDHEYAFPVAMRGAAHGKVFGAVRGTPTLFLIDRKGVLRFSSIGRIGKDKLEALLLPLL
jgi:peroxiredoxin